MFIKESTGILRAALIYSSWSMQWTCLSLQLSAIRIRLWENHASLKKEQAKEAEEITWTYCASVNERRWKWVTQSCTTLCNPMEHTVHEILQARIPEWVAMPCSRGFSQPRDWIQVSHFAGIFFSIWATREVLRIKPGIVCVYRSQHRRPCSSYHSLGYCL